MDLTSSEIERLHIRCVCDNIKKRDICFPNFDNFEYILNRITDLKYKNLINKLNKEWLNCYKELKEHKFERNENSIEFFFDNNVRVFFFITIFRDFFL